MPYESNSEVPNFCPYCPDEPQMVYVEPSRLRCPMCGRERDKDEMVPGRVAWEKASHSDDAHEGWYGPPNSRRFHYFGPNGAHSLCGKWLVLAWSADLIDIAYGPANGDCAACKAKLASRKGATPGTRRA